MEMIVIELPQTPKTAKQTLVELANYYRQLVSQYQKVTEEAKSQLLHVEALLSSITDNQEVSSGNGKATEALVKVKSESKKSKIAQPEKTEVTSITSVSVSEIQSKTKSQSPIKNVVKAKKTESKKLQKKSTANNTSNKNQVATNKNQINTNNNLSSNNHISNDNSRLPKRDKMAEFATTVLAVSQCLQEYYPRAITSSEILNWLYPQGLSVEEKKDAYQAISNCLVKNSGKRGWERTSVGKYLWIRKS